MSRDPTNPPTIAISRTSTESRASSSRSANQIPPYPSPRPSAPRLDTHQAQKRHWSRLQKSEYWKRRQGRDLKWHIKWSKDCFPNGRVLIIDYVSNEHCPRTEGPGKRHAIVAAQEFEDLKSLKNFYSNRERVQSAALRVIHVQNATWATQFLLKKFNIDNPNDLVGMRSFSRWARYEKPRQRNGKPCLDGRSFQAQLDPWRNVSRTAFGLDYLKCYKTPEPSQRRRNRVFGDSPIDVQMMHLNAYEDSSSPCGHDVSVQRLSVYVQKNLGPPGEVSPEQNVKSPYIHAADGVFTGASNRANSAWNADGRVVMEDLDNSNTVIIFETSASLNMDDCLIQPRNEFESRWRRLSFYLRREDILSDSRLATQCANFILTDVFHGLAVVWEDFLARGIDHIAILEEKIYENPADESRAPELWTNSAAFLKVDKIMWIHQDLVREMKSHLREVESVDDDQDDSTSNNSNTNSHLTEWLLSTTVEYERLAHNVQEDLIQPTANLSDLMYKSVGIRDSRQSLQLSLSMWRLSWITFIFLPLTFIVSFFGMNVDLFQNYPSVGWYFLASAILMIFVLLLWYCVKHSLQRKRQTPYQRGLYEHLFSELEGEYPALWSVQGALDDIQEPNSFVAGLKWRLLKRWFAPHKTINKKLYTSLAGDDADLGAWASFKLYLLRRWLRQIVDTSSSSSTATAATAVVGEEDPLALAELGGRPVSPHPSLRAFRKRHEAGDSYGGGVIQELAKVSTPLVVAEGEPTAIQQIGGFGLTPLVGSERRRSSSRRGSSEEWARPGSRGSSGMMVEERNLSDSESEVVVGATTRGREEEGETASR